MGVLEPCLQPAPFSARSLLLTEILLAGYNLKNGHIGNAHLFGVDLRLGEGRDRQDLLILLVNDSRSLLECSRR